MYKDSKIYTDSSHFIAILHRPNPKAFRPKVEAAEYYVLADGTYRLCTEADGNVEFVRKTTRKDEFNNIYAGTVGMAEDERNAALHEAMLPFFDNAEDVSAYVHAKLRAKALARQARATRFRRKACLNLFTYYCTFTYDDAKCSFEEFDSSIRVYFNNMACRHGWKVMFVPEYGKKTGRYHLHALIYIPRGETIHGEFREYRRYNMNKCCMVDVCENSYFAERWGANDWQYLDNMGRDERKRAVNYVIKYLTKSEERAYYSRGIPTFIVSHIRAEDIIDRFDRQKRKGVLFDDFHIFYQGVDFGPFVDDCITVLGAT